MSQNPVHLLGKDGDCACAASLLMIAQRLLEISFAIIDESKRTAPAIGHTHQQDASRLLAS
jgi:hypothetical protein